MSIITNIISEMENQHMSAAQLCRLAHISQGNFSDWKNGRSEPKAEAISKIANSLGVSTDYLLGKEKSNEEKSPEEPKLSEEEMYLEKELIAIFRQLNRDGKRAVISSAIGASSLVEYTRKLEEATATKQMA